MEISKLKILKFGLISLLFIPKLNAQLGINDNNTPPAANAILDVKSANKGMLIPRITTTNRNALSGEGMVVFDTDTKSFWYHNGSAWVNNWVNSGANIYNGNSGNVGIGTTNPTSKLDLNGSLKIVNGTQGSAKVLTSDGAGLATWQALPTASGFPLNIPEIVNWRGNYAAGTSYAINDLVTSTNANIYYYSLTANNIAHTPESSPTFWQAVTFYQLKQIYKAIPLTLDAQSTPIITFPEATYFFRGKIIYSHNSISTGNGLAIFSAETDFNIIKTSTTSGSNNYTDASTKFGLGQNGLGNSAIVFFFNSHTVNLTTDIAPFAGTPTVTSNGIYFRLIPLGGQVGANTTPTTITLVP